MAVKLLKDSLDVGLVVRDHAASVAFYCDILGLQQLRTVRMLTLDASMIQLACGNSVIKLIQLDTDALSAPATRAIDSAYGYRYITLSVENIDEVVHSCVEHGYAVPVGLANAGENVRFAIVADPDGNWIELVRAS
jgi:catechol 2,3-dioxygenase-like lactoylglutathione lyase family enzyme